MSNLSQLFDAGRFPGGVEVRPDGKAAVMTLRGPANGSLRLVLPVGRRDPLLQPDLYPSLASGAGRGKQYPPFEFLSEGAAVRWRWMTASSPSSPRGIWP